MAYIYQIINHINGKVYIGQTSSAIQKRFKEHCHDSSKENLKNRPLYAAMRKYGIENFSIELVEETDNPNEREIFWIQQKNSYHNGYNATLGGEGTKTIDYDLVVQKYNEIQNQKKVAQELGINETTVFYILHAKDIKIKSSADHVREAKGIAVAAYDKNNNFIQSFPTQSAAAQWLIENNKTKCKPGTMRTHISEVVRGIRKTAAGYIWKNIES